MSEDKETTEVKETPLTKEEAGRIESVFFEDDVEVQLRDGKSYKIIPASLKDARTLMNCLRTVNVDVILLNFVPTEDAEIDKKREEDLYSILKIAFRGYPDVDIEYLKDYIDLSTARKIIDVVLGLNEIKK